MNRKKDTTVDFVVRKTVRMWGRLRMLLPKTSFLRTKVCFLSPRKKNCRLARRIFLTKSKASNGQNQKSDAKDLSSHSLGLLLPTKFNV